MLQNKCILVTGANGFVGSHVCAALEREGARVVGTARRQEEAQAPSCVRRVVDMLDSMAVSELVADVRPEFIVHLAATKSRVVDLSAFRAGYDTNLIGTLNLVEACLASACASKFVHLGSCEEYGGSAIPFDEASRESPVTAYGISKLAVTHLLEAAAKNQNFPVVILRPTNVYGPGQRNDMFLPALIEALALQKEFPMTQGEQTRDYVYVDDLVDAIISALILEVSCGSIINISSGMPVRIKDVALMVANSVGPDASRLLLLGAKDYRPGEAMDYWASNTRASQLLGWAPRVSLEEGVARTVANVRQQMVAG